MSWEEENFEEMKQYDSQVKVGDGRSLPVKGIGNIKMSIICLKGTIVDLVVHDVLYVPDLSTNLISIGKLNKKGFKIVFEDDKCRIHLSQETIIECKQPADNDVLSFLSKPKRNRKEKKIDKKTISSENEQTFHIKTKKGKGKWKTM